MSEIAEKEVQPVDEIQTHTEISPDRMESNSSLPIPSTVQMDPFLGIGLLPDVSQNFPAAPTLPECISEPGSMHFCRNQIPEGLSTQPFRVNSSMSIPESMPILQLGGQTGTMPYFYQSPYANPQPSRLAPGYMTSNLASGSNGPHPAVTFDSRYGPIPQSGLSAACSIQVPQNRNYRREDVYRISQNPWGPNAVFEPRIPRETQPWQLRQMTSVCDASSLPPMEDNHSLSRPDDGLSLYAKYGRHHGIVRRMRRKIVDVSGKVCQNFLVWVIFVAAFAGLEGFKERSDSLKKTDVEWTDSDVESEPESLSKFNVLSFKG